MSICESMGVVGVGVGLGGKDSETKTFSKEGSGWQELGHQMGKHLAPWRPFRGQIGKDTFWKVWNLSHFFLLVYTDFPSSMKDRKKRKRRKRRGRRKRTRRWGRGGGGRRGKKGRGEFCNSLQLNSIIPMEFSAPHHVGSLSHWWPCFTPPFGLKNDGNYPDLSTLHFQHLITAASTH